MTEALFSEWTTYRKVVENDYMHHHDYFGALASIIDGRFSAPIHVLDIGCGDAAPVLDLLATALVARYVGLDESSSALSLAGETLASTDVPFELIAGSMESAIEGVTGTFDLIVASYSLHHLDGEQKQKMLSRLKSLLAPGGMIAVIDVFLEPGETRDRYQVRWEEDARSRFKALAPAELDELVSHIRGSDLPETLEDYSRWAMDAGFEQVRQVARGPARLNQFISIT
ncbi:MAG: class I SAM-dependent methyltransferase [Pseudomonadales bacterium]|nr:class I SAM-dependent methyltransferase [Pseudomonadales bacterium]